MKIKSFSSAIILLIAMFSYVGVYAQQDTQIYDQVDTYAQMPQGKQEISNFIYANLVYPADAVGSGISGMVMTKFIIEIDGTISNIEIYRPLNPLLDAEAIRVVGSIPGTWIPAMIGGQAVRTYFYIPVLFSDPKE
ncbi:MAG: energy transducer TonB [Bacteroidales bacterium]|nr:energy transducer TonB [Bacteroidales bacterium]